MGAAMLRRSSVVGGSMDLDRLLPHPPSSPRLLGGGATGNSSARASTFMGGIGSPRPSVKRVSSSLELPYRGGVAAMAAFTRAGTDFSDPPSSPTAARAGPARGILTQDSASSSSAAASAGAALPPRRCGALRTGSDVLRSGVGQQGGVAERGDSPRFSSGSQPSSPLANRGLVPTTLQQQQQQVGPGRMLPRKTASCSTLSYGGPFGATPGITARPRLSWASSSSIPGGDCADGDGDVSDGDGDEPTRNTAPTGTFSRTSTAARRSAVFLLSSGGAEAKGGSGGPMLPSILAAAGTESNRK